MRKHALAALGGALFVIGGIAEIVRHELFWAVVCFAIAVEFGFRAHRLWKREHA